MSTRCVVGYDGSEPSRAALRWALERDVPVVVAHVTQVDNGTMGEQRRLDDVGRGAQAIADAIGMLEHTHPNAQVSAVRLDGPVAWALSEYAEADDLLVVGTHKTGFLHGRVLGSQSVGIAMLARCDVAVIPSSDLRFRKGVLAGVDDDPTLDAVVRTATREAVENDRDLLLVHGSVAESAESVSSVMSRASSTARAAAPDIRIRSRASSRPAAELILDSSRDRALIVIGNAGGDRTRSPIGSVLHDILLNINAPTMVVHPDRPPSPG